MKCHYEVLNVPRDADLAEIKSAYRKLALKWHPDKNLNNTDDAKEQFQLVQQAYEVLSDSQERAWYDNHREQILRGSNSEFEDKSLDVFQFFTTTCFKGYGDDEQGFYTVYRNVFNQIIEEDLEFIDDKEEFCEIPRFGDSKSDYDDIVGPFYAYWSSYCTKKSYVWLDPYDIKETRERRVLKLMEKENKKVRQKARKERNDEIRNLVAFVRKRDKRVQERTKLLEAKVLENRQKQEELSKQKRLERKKQLRESGEQAEWAKWDNMKSELAEIEKHLAKEFGEEFSNSEDEDEEEMDNNLYCVACNKVFKTPRAFENHESSKKHKENVEKLRETMLEEDRIYDGEDLSDNGELSEKSDLSSSSKEKLENTAIVVDEDELSLNSEVDEDSKSKKSKKKNKKSKNVLKVDHDTVSDLNIGSKLDSDDNFDFESTKKQKKKTKKSNKSKVENKITENGTAPAIIEEEPITNKSNKKKQNKKEADLEEVDTSHCCVTCKSNFPSKNKLFDHLKKTGHGVYLPSKSTKSRSSKGVKEK